MPSEGQVPSRPDSTLPTVPASFCIHCLNNKGRTPLAGVRRPGGPNACRTELNVGIAGQIISDKVPPESIRTAKVNGDLRSPVEEENSAKFSRLLIPLRSSGAGFNH
jgi:hypothetical protein